MRYGYLWVVIALLVAAAADHAHAQADCANRPPPPHMARATECLWQKGGTKPEDYENDCSKWQSFFHTGRGFPQGSVTRQFFQNPNEYLALEFNTGYLGENLTGRVLLAAAQYGSPATFQGGRVLASFSKCPGDFHGDAIISESEPACFGMGFPMFKSAGYDGHMGPSWGFCELEPNTTYYLNVVYTRSDEGTPPELLEWGCTGGGQEGEQSRCGTLISWKED